MKTDPANKKRSIPRMAFVVMALVLTIVGFVLGLWAGSAIVSIAYFETWAVWAKNLLMYGLAVAVAAIGLGLAAPAYLLLNFISIKIEEGLRKFSSKEILMGIIGLVLGVLLSVLILQLVDIPYGSDGVRTLVGICMGLLLGYVGMRIGARMLYDLLPATNLPRPARLTSRAERNVVVLDSSGIIDGRVLDIVRTGFLTGKVIVPEEVLSELSRIADSDDILKQNRGRRGLDIVSALQKEKNVEVIVAHSETPAKNAEESVLAAAREANGKIVTEDSNFARLAAAQNIETLNINDLANALRPIALPGEKLTVQIVKKGKEQGQGVAYTPDGTMIVVENGGGYVGQTMEAVVTTSLQTSSGRIVFVRVAE